MSIKSRLLLSLTVFVMFLGNINAQPYTPLQITPAWGQFRGLKSQHYPFVAIPDSILVKNPLGWIGRYPFSNLVLKDGTYPDPNWITSLSYSKISNLPTYFPTDINNVLGLSGTLQGYQANLNNKLDVGASIPYSTITGTPTLFSGSFTDLTNRPTSYPSTIGQIPNLQSQLDGKQPLLGYTPYNGTTNPNGYISSSGAPVQSVNGQTGNVVITTPALTAGAINSALGYTAYNATLNSAGFVTAGTSPVTSVNAKTGAVVVNATDVGLGNVNNTSDANKPISTATQIALNAKLNSANIPFSKVRYYSVTSDAAGLWSVNLGSEFTSITDVQVQAVSVANTVAGIRQVSLNAWTSTSTSLSGITFGSNTIATVLISAVQSLAVIPNTGVRVVVYGN